MPRLNIITAFDAAFAAVGDIAARSIGQYAAAIGQDFQVLPIPKGDRPAAWGKIAALYHALGQGDHEMVMWVDADACFVRADRDILDEIDPGKDLHLVMHRVTVGAAGHPGLYLAADRPNTGVMVLKKSDWTFRLLDAVWNKTEFLDHPLWENAAVMDLLGYRVELTGNLADNVPQPEWTDRLGVLPLEWNSCPTPKAGHCCETFDPIILHCVGLPFSERVAIMTEWTECRGIPAIP